MALINTNIDFEMFEMKTSSFPTFDISVTVDVVCDPPVRTIVDEST